MRTVFVAMLLVACGRSSAPPSTASPTRAAPPAPSAPPASDAGPTTSPPPEPTPAPPTPPGRPDPHSPSCKANPNGWCAAPGDDPCGAHPDVASCRADKRCGGMAYTGESVVACKRDARGFGVNCPTVGCVSL